MPPTVQRTIRVCEQVLGVLTPFDIYKRLNNTRKTNCASAVHFYAPSDSMHVLRILIANLLVRSTSCSRTTFIYPYTYKLKYILATTYLMMFINSSYLPVCMYATYQVGMSHLECCLLLPLLLHSCIHVYSYSTAMSCILV